MTRLLVVSDDYWGARAEASIPAGADIVVVVDRSGGLSRSIRLVLRGSVPPRAAAAMLLTQLRLPSGRPRSGLSLSNNADLLLLAKTHSAREVILFRAGLIISGQTLGHCPVYNIHCADIHGFGGLASIWRALRVQAFDQRATLHQVTNRIDEGEVRDTEPYSLDRTLGYSANEALAYEAGLRLLRRTLRHLHEAATP